MTTEGSDAGAPCLTAKHLTMVMDAGEKAHERLLDPAACPPDRWPALSLLACYLFMGKADIADLPEETRAIVFSLALFGATTIMAEVAVADEIGKLMEQDDDE